MGIFNFLKHQNTKPVHMSDVDRRILIRHYEILVDCDELVHTSKNFEIVLRRYDEMLDELSFIASYEDAFGSEYLSQCGLRIKTDGGSVADLWEKIRTNGTTLLNAAVDRCLDAEIDAALKLKTKSGQEKRMLSWVDKMQSVEAVPADTLKYLSALPVLDALREPKVLATCRCGVRFRCRPHAYLGYIVICPKCGQRLRVDTSGKQG